MTVASLIGLLACSLLRTSSIMLEVSRVVVFRADDVSSVHTQIRRQKFVIFFLRQDQQAFPIFDVLPLNDLLNHLRIENHLDCARVYLILHFAATQHASYLLHVIHGLVRGHCEV